MNKNKISVAFALFLMFAMTFSLIAIPESVASVPPTTTKTTGPFPAATPNSWINLITTTSNGEYRPEPSVTNYPRTSSPIGDIAKTGYSAGSGPLTNHVLWRDNIPVSLWTNLVIDNGTISFVSTAENAIYNIDQNTGQVNWKLNITAQGQWWPQLVDGVILFTAIRNGVNVPILVGEESGNVVWSCPNATTTYTGLIGMLACPQGMVFYRGDAIYVNQGNQGNFTMCYELNNHDAHKGLTLMWNSTNVRGRLSYSNGRLYGVTNYSPWVSCANASTGALIWNYTGTGNAKDTFYPAPVVADGLVFLSTDTETAGITANDLIVLNATTGQFVWKYCTGGAGLSCVTVAYGRAYLAGAIGDASVYCLNDSNGRLLWNYTAPGEEDYYNCQIANGAIYLDCSAYPITGFPAEGTYPGYSVCVNATTGKEIWRYAEPTSCTCVWVSDGNFYTNGAFDYVYCLGPGPTTTTLTPSTLDTTVGNAVVISGSVTDESPFSQQNPALQSPCVSGVPVVLSYVDSNGDWTDFGTTTTNSAGQFTYSFTPTSAGAYKIVARFEGNNAYYWSSAQTNAIQVNPAAPSPTPPPASLADMYLLPATIAIIIAIIVVGAVLVLMLRKR